MEADSLYINVYKNLQRREKEILPTNENFVCMVDYNIDGETTLVNGGIFKSIWDQLYKRKNRENTICMERIKVYPKNIL